MIRSGSGKPDPEIRGVEPFQVDWLVLAPKWQPLNGVDPICWILKPSGSNILHDNWKNFHGLHHNYLTRMKVVDIDKHTSLLNSGKMSMVLSVNIRLGQSTLAYYTVVKSFML